VVKSRLLSGLAGIGLNLRQQDAQEPGPLTMISDAPPPGDAGAAFYARAAEASQAGRETEAVQLLNDAVTAGSMDAAFTLGQFLLHGIGTAQDLTGAYQAFSLAASARITDAVRAQAVLQARGIGTEADWSGACERLLVLARAADAAALRQVGVLVLMSAGDDGIAYQLLLHAAARGDLMAALALARAAIATEVPGLTPGAARWLVDACARAQHPMAADVAKDLVATPEEPLAPTAGPDWEQVAALLAVLPHRGHTAAENLSPSPSIQRLPGFFSLVECDYVAGLAAPLLGPARIFDPATGQAKQDPYRRSLVANLAPMKQDLVLVALEQRISRACEIPLDHGEMLAVLAYGPGHEYKPHRDYIIDDGGAGTADLARGGQRIATFLTALNDDFEGGETAFPQAGLTVKLHKGDGLLFRNVDSEGQIDPATLHAGLPVKSGSKWLASKWMRQHRYTW